MISKWRRSALFWVVSASAFWATLVPGNIAWGQTQPLASIGAAQDYAAQKAGMLVEKVPPLAEGEDYTAWFVRRHYDEKLPIASDEAKRQWRCAQEDLRAAQALFASPDRQTARQGLALASQLELLALGTWKDPRFAAEVVASQIVPHLDLAFVEDWRPLSRSHLLQNAASAFAANGQTQETRQALLWLIDAGEAAEAPAYSDWARYQLAYLLADNGRFAQAISTLQAIQGENFRQSAQILIDRWSLAAQ